MTTETKASGETAPTASGSCLCGSVHYTVRGPLRPVWACHCHRCQKATGNFMAATGAPAAAIDVRQFDALRWYSPDDDPNVAYGFCRRCGSSVFWRAADADSSDDDSEHWSICAGTLDESPALTTEAVWFSDHVAPHNHLHPDAAHLPASDC